MMINNKEYLPFLMKNIFNISKGKRLTKENMVAGNLNYLGAISDNNGVRESIEAVPTHKGNSISVNYNGSVGESFYQKDRFWASDDVNILELKGYKLNKNIALFLCTVIRLNKFKFNYGRKWTLDKMNDSSIYLPITNEKKPDWQYMNDFIKNLNYNSLSHKFKTHIIKKKQDLNIENWKKFKIGDLFIVSGAKTTPKLDIFINGHGNYPYVTTQSTNNGVEGFYNYFTEFGEVLVVDSAVVGYCSYQESNFSASDHVEKLELKNCKLNKYIALFLVTIMNQENYRYSYGRKFSQVRIRDTTIKLPVDKNGLPDWEFMENYIKSLPYSDKI